MSFGKKKLILCGSMESRVSILVLMDVVREDIRVVLKVVVKIGVSILVLMDVVREDALTYGDTNLYWEFQSLF